TDENLVGLTNALIDDGLLDFESGTRVEFPREEPGVETTEPWIEENGLVSERDLPAVGPEPRHLDASGPRATARRRRLRAFGDPWQQQPFAPVDGGPGHPGRETAAEESPTRDWGLPRRPAGLDEAHRRLLD